MEANPQTVVIVTGGQGPDETEPEGVVMGRYLESQGIDPNRIIVESTSTTTVENIQNASSLHDISTTIVVSNDFHIYRAKRTATQNGVSTVYGLAAPSKTKATFVSSLREVVALGYHFIFTH
ncbi:YdcF family protein [Erysipelothrix sp. D19-032]